MSYDDLCNDYVTVLLPLCEPIQIRDFIDDDDVRASVQEATENSDDFQSRLKEVTNVAQNLYQSLRLRKEAMGKFPKMTHAHVQRVFPVLPVRARARSFRCHRKAAATSSSSGDDDGGSDSSNSDPDVSVRRHLLAIPTPKSKFYSPPLPVVVSPWQMSRGFEVAVAA